MNKFKVRDKVRCIGERDDKEGMGWEKGLEFMIETVGSSGNVYFPAKNNDGVFEDYLELVTNTKPIKFLLQYERDEGPIEEFATLVEIRKRIKELTKDSEVKQDSFVIYEIKKVYNVEITKQVNLKSAK